MTKSAKIIIGISAVLIIAGTITYFATRPEKDEDEEWDVDLDGEVSPASTGTGSGTPPPTPLTTEQRKKNNFEAVKKYFGSGAGTYRNRIIIKRTTSNLARLIGKTPADYGLRDEKISLVYWDNGQFTVKVGSTKGFLKGHYYKEGTEIKVSGGVGKLALKKGLIEKDKNPLNAIAKAFLR